MMNELFILFYALGCILTFLYFKRTSKHLENVDYNTMSIVSVAWPLYWIVWGVLKIFA